MEAKKIGIMIPAFNEEAVIGACLASIQKIFSREDVYVVSDGSTDKTADIARKYTVNVLEIENAGKAKAIERLIHHYGLLQKYEWLVFHDADSQLGEDFLPILQESQMLDDSKIACILGQIQSRSKRWNPYTSLRAVQYFISHRVYKKAQGVMRNILVAPGCLSIYRSRVLSGLSFDNDTVTEDLDLTFQIHRQKLGRIVYLGKLPVSTQDPMTFKDYYRQIKRWYMGFAQTCRKHRFPRFQSIDFEIGLFFLENIMIFLLVGLLPSLILFYPKIVIMTFAFMLLSSFALCAFVALGLRRPGLLFVFPMMTFFQLFECIISISAFFRCYFMRKSGDLAWEKPDRW